MTAVAVLVYPYFILCNITVFESQEKMFKTSVNARTLSFNVIFLENPSEYPHKPYIVRNKSPCRRFAPLTVCVYLY